MAQNVKVAIRVRNVPKWFGRDGSKDTAEYQTPIVTVDQPNPSTKIYQHLTIGSQELQKEIREFSYDFVFAPADGQEILYNNLVSPLIAKCVQGFNGCVFVYGQTASGKTYTMGGPAVANPNDRGIILRVAQHLIDYIDKNGRKDLGKAGFDFTVTGSYMEIYNEQLKDLLGSNKEELKIRLDPTSISGKDVYVQGLTQVPLISEKDYIKAIETGVSKRRVAETNMNAVSSRSHSILTLTIIQREYLEGGKEGIKRRSKIHLIDLAGSERAESTGATGQVLKEGAAINQSLSCLGNVINALSTGSTHVPYRDSKLTHLLSDSLGGNSLTILVACLTPIAGAYEETISTLKFAERVKKIKNKAVLNVDANTLRIMALEAENAELKEKLAKCSCGKSSAAAAEPSSALKEKLKNKLAAIFKGMDEDVPKPAPKPIEETINTPSIPVHVDPPVIIPSPSTADIEDIEERKDSVKMVKASNVANLWRRKSRSIHPEPEKIQALGISVIMQPDPTAHPDTPTPVQVIEEERQHAVEQQQELVELKTKKSSLSQEFRDFELLIEQEEERRIQVLSEAADIATDDEYRKLKSEYDAKQKALLVEKEGIEKELATVKEQLSKAVHTEVRIPIGEKQDQVAVSKTENEGLEILIVNPEPEVEQHQSEPVQNDDDMSQYYQQMLQQALEQPSTTQAFMDNPDAPKDLSAYKPYMKHQMEINSDDDTDYFAFQKVSDRREIVRYKWFVAVAAIFGLAIGFAVGNLFTKYATPVSSDASKENLTPISAFPSSPPDSSSTVITTLVAGSSYGYKDGSALSAKFTHLRGVAVNASGFIFVVDQENQNIRLISPISGQVTTFAGSTTQQAGLVNGAQALFSYPRDIFSDNRGNIWIADCGNSLVRKIDSKGFVSSFYDTGGCPSGIVVNSRGNVFIADSETNIIFNVLPNGQLASLIGTGQHGKRDGPGVTATFSTVNHLAIDSNDNIYVSDCGKCQTTANNPGSNNLIRMIDTQGVVSTIASSAFCGPNYLAVSPSTGNLLVSQDCSTSTDSVVRYVQIVGNGFGIDGVFTSNDEISPAFGLAFHPNGQMAVFCSDHFKIYSISR